MVWPDALADGLVVGEPDSPANFARRTLPRTDINALTQELTASQVAAIAAEVAGLEASILAEFQRVSQRAVALGWSEAQYVQAITAAANNAGMVGFQGSWASTWYNNLLGSTYNAGIISRFRRQPTVRLFPYLTVETVNDGARRPNHGHMQGFTAAPTWSGWSIASPLYGHRCRCRVRPRTWRQARAAGWTGELPAQFAAQLSTWSGPDPGWAGSSVV